MSLQRDAKQARVETIMQHLDKSPMTLKELQEAVGASYHTVRNDVMNLVNLKHVSPAGTRDGSLLFKAGGTRPMPMLWHKPSGRSVSLMDIAMSYASKPQETSSSKAALDVPAVAAEMLYMLALHLDRGHPNHKDLSERNRDIQHLRSRLTHAVIHLDGIMSMAQQMLENKRLWTTDGLGEIVGDPLFSTETAIAAYETLLHYRSEADRA